MRSAFQYWPPFYCYARARDAIAETSKPAPTASSEARDRNSPTKAHQSSLQISLIGRQHRPIRLHLLADRVSGDSGEVAVSV